MRNGYIGNIRKASAVLLCLGALAFLFHSCVQSTPGGQQGNSQQPTEAGTQPEASQQAVIVFDEKAGIASTTANYYFLFDMSGSMDDNCSGKRKIDGAKEAVKRFMKNVPDDVNLGLMLFGTGSEDDFKEAIPLGQGNKEKFLQIIAGLEPQGGTPIGQVLAVSVDKVVEQYKRQLGYGTYRIIIVTDGQENSASLLRQSCKYLAKHGFIGLYSIGLCMSRSHTLKDYSLSYRDASDYEALEKALVEATAETTVFDPNAFDQSLYGDSVINK